MPPSCAASALTTAEPVPIGEEAWSSYISTVVEFRPLGGEPFVLHPAATGITDEWPKGFIPPVHILTAWDPGPERPGEAVNRARQAELESELRVLGLHLCPTIGRDVRTGHSEEGVGISGMEREAILAVAATYGQDAIFEWTPEALLTISCDHSRGHVSGWLISPGPGDRPAGQR
jgi:hypothetical protein